MLGSEPDFTGITMRNLICCWCNSDSENFENHVPLVLSGNRNTRLGFENRIDILFLSGFDRLTDAYKAALKNTGYRLHDVSGLYRELVTRYSPLDRFGDYEKKCFLRWPIIAKYFPNEPVVHYDGDIVFNEDPAVIARLFRHRTFVLQGCPALTAITDDRWFAQYNHELDLFVNDIEGYSQRAWKEREGWQVSEKSKWAGQRYREIISSDQDLLSHLIHTDRIIQATPSDVMGDLQSYIVAENPLYLHHYDPTIRNATYRRTSGIDYIDGRRVLLWHMQSDFTKYLSTFVFMKTYLRWARMRTTNHVEKAGLDTRLHNFFLRRLHGKADTRLSLCKYFFESGDFSDVFTGQAWWQEGVFSTGRPA
jgi:hypothetical protein